MTKQGLDQVGAMLTNEENEPAGRKSTDVKFNGLKRRAGKIKYGCLAWLIGLPLPIVILLMFYKGCDF